MQMIKKASALLFLILISTSAYAETNYNAQLPSFAELSETYVTTVTKKPEIQFKTASSISVVTQEDIRRSGATSIPEALRYTPGINVAQIDSNRWAISSRGFNRQYSNKLLVLIDGRSIYTPVFSGVFWDIQDTVLADVDRIEVIRGPGATIWGSNAVNGVINIITKKAQNTQGTYASLLYGNQEDGTLELRHGGQINNETFYRVYSKALGKDELTNLADQTGNDDQWKQYKVGFRVDSDLPSNTEWNLSGELYSGDLDQTQNFPGLITPAVTASVSESEKTQGFHLLGNWEKQGFETHQKIQSYIDYHERDSDNLLKLQALTFDINYHNTRKLNSKNELIWGLGYRHIRDSLESRTLSNGQSYLEYFPDDISGNIYSGFVQNEYKAIPDVLHFIVGAKIEHHYFTDFEFQPNARFAWYPSNKQTVWGAVSRAVRTPTIAEQSISLIAASTPGGFVRLAGNSDYKSEDLTAFELGHRYKATQKLAFDTSVFLNIYDNLRTFEPGVSPFPSTGTIAALITENFGSGEAYGFEIEAKYVPLKNWSLTANYSYIDLALHADKKSNDTSIPDEELKTPEQQFSLLSRVNLPNNFELDTNFSFVDELEAFDIPSYTRFDTRLGWKPREGIEVSLVGLNLLKPSHPEFKPFLYGSPAEVDRSMFVKLDLNF